MLLLVDNYDSFVHNLARSFRELGAEVRVVRNDAPELRTLHERPPAGIVISPGPDRPADAGESIPIVHRFADVCPILGVCLGHQAIGEAFGGRVVRALRPTHGKTSQVTHDGSGLFNGVPSPTTVTRYHSLVVDPDSLPDVLRVTASCLDVPERSAADRHFGTTYAAGANADPEPPPAREVIMGLVHKTLPVHGVQFHPESILSESGYALLRNFLLLCGYDPKSPAELESLPGLVVKDGKHS